MKRKLAPTKATVKRTTLDSKLTPNVTTTNATWVRKMAKTNKVSISSFTNELITNARKTSK